MANIFFSHSHVDGQLADELVTDLRSRGHTCWNYRQNSMAGESYIKQIFKAISDCDVFLVIVSSSAFDSRQVQKELEQAWEKNRKLLPVLSGVSRDDLQRESLWSQVMGTTAFLCANSLPPQALATEIDRFAQRIRPFEPAPKTAVWAADGQIIDINTLASVVVETEDIRLFLNSPCQYFLSAAKGTGKTLLMKYKRFRLMQEHHRESRCQVQFLPEAAPFLDMLSGGMITVTKERIHFLGSLRNCRRLWAFAIRTSVILCVQKQHPNLQPDGFPEAARIARVAEMAVSELLPDGASTTTVFQNLLKLKTQRLNRLLDEAESPLEYAFRQIHHGVCVFIDRIDQGLPETSRTAWIHLQAGLLEAAWDVMASNNHVKVYATIREEAWNGYNSPTKNNVYAATNRLTYTKQQLGLIIDGLSRIYEQAGSFQQFTGLTEVKNQHCRIREGAFDYVLRHTLERPRDLVIICRELSQRRQHLDEVAFREQVNCCSSGTLIANVFSEMEVLLNCLGERDLRERFFRLLPGNVLSRREIERVFCRFNDCDESSMDELLAPGVNSYHPFCDLYNCGLLGLVRSDPAQAVTLQKFRRSRDIQGDWTDRLPEAEHYILHPSLQLLIQQKYGNTGYYTFPYIRVGHDCPWFQHYDPLRLLLCSIREHLREPDRRSISEFLDVIHGDFTGKPDPEKYGRTKYLNLWQQFEARGLDEIAVRLEDFIDSCGV